MLIIICIGIGVERFRGEERGEESLRGREGDRKCTSDENIENTIHKYLAM